MAVARRYGAGETSSRRNFVLAHSLGCSLALRLAAEWGTNGVSVAALALLGATQLDWLTEAVANSTRENVRWQLVAQQIIVQPRRPADLLRAAQSADEAQQREAWLDLLDGLTSDGELKICEREGGAAKIKIKLENVQRVDRTKGEDFYDFCIDLDIEVGSEETTISMRPPGRTDMQSWLGVLKEQVDLHAARKEKDKEAENKK